MTAGMKAGDVDREPARERHLAQHRRRVVGLLLRLDLELLLPVPEVLHVLRGGDRGVELLVRVTDGQGNVAPDEYWPPLPDGATGWPQRTVHVA